MDIINVIECGEFKGLYAPKALLKELRNTQKNKSNLSFIMSTVNMGDEDDQAGYDELFIAYKTGKRIDHDQINTLVSLFSPAIRKMEDLAKLLSGVLDGDDIIIDGTNALVKFLNNNWINGYEIYTISHTIQD